MAVKTASRNKIRPALWNIKFWGPFSERLAGKWQWVALEELVEVAGKLQGIPGNEKQDLLYEFADFQFRGSKYKGVCIAAFDPGADSWFLFVKLGLRRLTLAPEAKYFFWCRADLTYGDDGPNSAYRKNSLGHICSHKELMVPSGWANGVLDEIKRRRKAGE